MADGFLKIDTGLDNTGIEKDLKELEKSLKNAGGDLEDSQRQAIEKVFSEYRKVEAQIEQNRQRQNELNQSQREHSRLLETEKAQVEALTIAREELAIAKQNYNENMNVETSNELKVSQEYANKLNKELEETRKKAEAINIEKVEKDLEKSKVQANGLAVAMDRVHLNVAKQREALDKTSQAHEKVSASSGKSSNNILKTAGALLGIRTLYAGIQKAVRAYNTQTEQGAQNTAKMNEMWVKLGSIIAPIINMAVSGLNSILDMFFKILGVFGIFPKTAQKSAKNMGGAVKQAKALNKEMKQLASFDEMNVLSSQDTSSSGGGGSVGVDFDTAGMSSFEKKFADIMKKVMADLQPFTDTIKNINWQPLIDSTKRLGNAFSGVFSVMYDSVIRTMNNAVAPFIKIMAEEIAPRAINAISEALEMITPHFDYLLQNLIEPLTQWLLTEFIPTTLNLLIAAFEMLIPIVDSVLEGMTEWYEFIKPVFSWLGEVALGAVEGITEAIEEFTGKVKDNEDGMGDLFKSIGFVIGAYLTLKGALALIGGAKLVFGGILGGIIKVFTVLKGIVMAVVSVFTGSLAGAIAVITGLVIILGLMITGLVTNFEQVKQDFMVIAKNIIGIFTGLYEFIAGVFTGNWKRAFKGLADAVINAFAGIANIVKFPINLIVDGVNAMIRGLNKVKVPKWVPGVGGKGINLPQVPRLALGGITTGATTAVIGEAGREAVIPLQNNTGWAKDFLDVLDSHGGGMGGNATIVVQTLLDGRVVAETVNKVNEEKQFRNNGRLAYG